MTDTTIDDELIDTTTRSGTTGRRPMFIETEVRTDTISKRRTTAGSTTTSRSVYDILENTKSPTEYVQIELHNC
jgi:hypothetical protein